MESTIEARRYRIVHELSERIRFHYPTLYDPALDAAYFHAVIENLPGVRRVRINSRGAGVVVKYNGRPEMFSSNAP